MVHPPIRRLAADLCEGRKLDPTMRGNKRKISLPRRFLIDFMHASMRVPAISFSRPLDVGTLMAARARAKSPPGWASVFVKAFAIVAQDEPVLRTLYVKLPWP